MLVSSRSLAWSSITVMTCMGSSLCSIAPGQVPDTTVFLWDASKETIHHAVALSPDGTYVASQGEGASIRLWSARTGKLLHILRGSQPCNHGFCFTRNGRWLAGLTEQSIAGTNAKPTERWSIWNVRTGALQRTLSYRPDQTIGTWTLSSDGQRIAAVSAEDASNDNLVLVLNAASGTLLRTIHVPHFDANQDINALEFSPDGTVLAVGVSAFQTGEIEVGGGRDAGGSRILIFSARTGR